MHVGKCKRVAIVIFSSWTVKPCKLSLGHPFQPQQVSWSPGGQSSPHTRRSKLLSGYYLNTGHLNVPQWIKYQRMYWKDNTTYMPTHHWVMDHLGIVWFAFWGSLVLNNTGIDDDQWCLITSTSEKSLCWQLSSLHSYFNITKHNYLLASEIHDFLFYFFAVLCHHVETVCIPLHVAGHGSLTTIS